MNDYQVSVSNGQLEQLMLASDLIMNNREDEANVLLETLLETLSSEDDITKLCASALKERNKVAVPMYLRDLDEEDKQINVFDLILRAVPSVEVTTSTALNTMLNLYGSGVSSFMHLNIGIGKGRFEMGLLQQLAQLDHDKIPRYIRIVGIDIDNASLRETGEEIRRIADELLPNTTVEYVPIFAFAEAINHNTWERIKGHNTDVLGVISAFTLHHIPTQEQRQAVIDRIAACDPHLFMLIEPDSNHFTPNLTERLVNCWYHFGTIFKLIDKQGLSSREARAIKYTFFGREIEDILGNEEIKRSEKHERATLWTDRIRKSGLSLLRLPRNYFSENILAHDKFQMLTPNAEQKYVTTQYENVPMVALFTASGQF